MVASGQEATISSLIPAMAQKLSENLIKKVEETKIRQTLTVTLDHLVQLERLGYGEASAIRLLAMGLMGYVTYEKMPQLIDAGIIDKQRVDGLEKVLSTMIRWMTDQSVEKGFRL